MRQQPAAHAAAAAQSAFHAAQGKKVARPDVVLEEQPAESARDASERLEAELERACPYAQLKAERDARREAAAE